MASVTRTRTSATLRRKSGRFLDLILTLFVPGLFNRGIATAAASCGSNFLFPTFGHEFFHLDTINVTFQSTLSQPALVCLCGEPGRPSEKFRIDHAVPSGSELVLLNFSSTDPCWFDLKADSSGCGDSSPTFTLLSRERPGSPRATIGLLSASAATSAATAAATSIPATALAASTTGLSEASQLTPAAAVASQEPPRGGNELSAGAKAGLGIGIAIFCIAAGAMASFLYFRRRKKGQGSEAAAAIIDHQRRHGRKHPFARSGAESVTSGRSDEPLYPIQPVFDGFPGSTGFDDIRSLHSMDPVSPSGGHSPNQPHATTYWTDRDELSAARLKSQPIPIVTSYGPNPVTPTLTPRPSSRVDLNIRAGSISTDSREGIPPMPAIPLMPDYSTYMPHPPSIPDPQPSPPHKVAQPIIMSYGPNRVTPTPAVTTPTVPPDESIFKRHKAPSPVPRPITSHDRQYSWELDDSEPAMTSSAMGPLPPYASTTDYYAMEKGAIRKLVEPRAEAELPPTKDGFYPYLTHAVEHELPGAAPQNEPQLPYNPRQYKRNHPEAGPSCAGGPREIDEQKFLLSTEVLSMRAQKVKKREDDESGEEYDLGERRR